MKIRQSKKCSHIIGLIALGEYADVNDERRMQYVVISGDSEHIDDHADGDYDIKFTFCPECGEKLK